MFKCSNIKKIYNYYNY